MTCRPILSLCAGLAALGSALSWAGAERLAVSQQIHYYRPVCPPVVLEHSGDLPSPGDVPAVIQGVLLFSRRPPKEAGFDEAAALARVRAAAEQQILRAVGRRVSIQVRAEYNSDMLDHRPGLRGAGYELKQHTNGPEGSWAEVYLKQTGRLAARIGAATTTVRLIARPAIDSKGRIQLNATSAVSVETRDVPPDAPRDSVKSAAARFRAQVAAEAARVVSALNGRRWVLPPSDKARFVSGERAVTKHIRFRWFGRDRRFTLTIRASLGRRAVAEQKGDF